MVILTPLQYRRGNAARLLRLYCITPLLPPSSIGNILEDVLTIAQAASDGQPEMTEVELTGAVEEAAAAFFDALEARGLEVDVYLPDTDVLVRAAQPGLSRILYNLLSNALEYGDHLVRVLTDAQCGHCIAGQAGHGDAC